MRKLEMLKIRRVLLRPTFRVAETKHMQRNMSVECPEARPFEKIPKQSIWNLMRNSFPGGKYYKMDLSKLLLAMKEDFGSIFLIPAIMGRREILITHNPTDFESVFRNEGIWPERPGQEALQYYREKYRSDFYQGVEGLIATQGEAWSTFRTAVNPILMKPKNIRLQFKKMSQVNRSFVDCIKNIRDPQTFEVPADFEDYINRWTFESVSVIALDKQLNLLNNKQPNPEAALLFRSLNEFFEYSTDLEVNPSPWRWGIPTPKFKKVMFALENIQKVASGYVKEAVERLDEEQKQGITRPESEQSVLEKLLKVDKKVGTTMAMDMLIAGVDTTSSTFAGILINIAKHPEKQAKLREEVIRILPNKDSEFTLESMNDMSYLRACIKESLRIYPLFVGNARCLKEDTVLSGYHVPKGTFVSMMALFCLKNEEFFPRPNEFLPERWLRPEKDTDTTDKCPAQELKATNPFVYLPFGFGPRMCIGRRIVDMELELGLARIIRNFQVEFNYPTENAFKAMIISTPNIPLKFKFTDIND